MNENNNTDDFKAMLEAYFEKNRTSKTTENVESKSEDETVESPVREYIIDFKSNPLKRVVINKFGAFGKVESYYILYPLTISEFQMLEKARDKAASSKNIPKFTFSDGTTVLFTNIKMFGKFDLNEQSDVDKMSRFLSKDIYDCHFIPREFDYDSLTSKSKGRFIQYTESTDYLKCFKYYHGRIGKPEYYSIVRLTPNAIAKS